MSRFAICCISLCVAVAFNAGAAAADVNATGSLYARLGGLPAVTRLVDATIDQVVASHRLNQSFKDTNLQRIKDKLVEQICNLGGGGCEYTGDPMRDVHAGHKISESEFYGMVELLRVNMREQHIGLRERNELLALLAPMKRDVVNVPAPPPPPDSETPDDEP